MATIFNCITESDSDLLVDPYLNRLRAPDLLRGDDAMLITKQQRFILSALERWAICGKIRLFPCPSDALRGKAGGRALYRSGGIKPVSGLQCEAVQRRRRDLPAWDGVP